MMKQTKWKLALGAFGLPFAVASVAMFCGLAEFPQWSGFVQLQVPAVLALYATSDVLHKTLLAKIGKAQKSEEA